MVNADIITKADDADGGQNDADTAFSLGERVIRLAAERGALIALAESCTGGLAADLLASVPGASRVFWGSFICYTLHAKAQMLGIDPLDLDRWGAVSRETAEAMARGALERSGSDIAVSVTGLAGPEGDGSPTPLGTVWIGAARRGRQAAAWLNQYQGDRNEIRRKAAAGCMAVLSRELEAFSNE